jgi:hypothetical protein
MTVATVTRLSSSCRPQDGLRFAVGDRRYFLGPMLSSGFRHLWQFTSSGNLPTAAIGMTSIAEPTDAQLLKIIEDGMPNDPTP